MKSIFVAFLLPLVIGCYAQQPMGKVYTIKVRKPQTDKHFVEEVVLECMDFQVVENDPEFPGGAGALTNFLKNAPYPANALYLGLEGSVTVKFIIPKNGKVRSISIASKSGNPELDNAAMAYVASMPSWMPGKQRGKPVNVLYETTIIYKLM